MMGEEKRDEYGDIVGGPKISKKQKVKNLAKNEKDEKITRSEETISELKTRTMLNYIDKASDSASKQLNKAKKFEKKGKLKKAGQARAKMDQREKGIAMAKDKIVKRQEDKTLTSLKRSYEGPDAMREEYISELSPATLGRYIKKAKIDIRDTATDRVMAITGIKGAKSKLDKTAAAVKNLQKAREKNPFATSTLPLSAPPEPPVSALPYNQRIRKRAIGINKATDKLVDKATPKTEEFVSEDDMKGMSVKSGHKRPTKAGAGMTKKGVEAYRRRNPGSKLKTAVTTKPSKLKKGSKAAKRRKSYCARSAGQMKKFPKAAKDPNSRLRQARRRWNC
jgi:hypothetical protein